MTDTKITSSLLAVKGLSISFGGVVAVDKLDLDIVSGEIHAVIGPNGAGKTTMINLMSGLMKPDSGQILFDGTDLVRLSPVRRSHLGIARSFQITSIFRHFSALANVALAVQAHDGHSFRMWRPAGRDERLLGPAAAHLEQVGLGARAEILAGNLAHGEQRQLEIAMALATHPRMLLLDEPTAGMGREDSERMVALLQSLRGQYTMLLVEHDMDVVFALADRITVLVYGRAIATGTPEEIRANAAVREAYLGEDEAA
ncbi:MAG: ABC transporter ATP-binding protein [Alphaproteobacteria bacterium]|nr:ABC transporter ATP-binding protein [Alphaproteobacteria bacterium]